MTRSWLERLVRFALLAPSSHNAQPWRFVIGSEHIELWADRSRQLRVCDPGGRELVMSCAAALMNLRVACRAFGWEGAVTLLPDANEPDLLAWAASGSPRAAGDEDRALFESLPRRRTWRRPFRASDIPDDVRERLRVAAEREGAWLAILDPARQAQAADLVYEATREQFRSYRFRCELASWMRPASEEADGIPGRALGFGPLRSRLAPWVLRGLDIGASQAERDRALALQAPVVAVLGTDRDTPAHWLRAGQALERVLLRATADGLAAAYLNAPVQLERFRADTAALVEDRGHPQIALRLGRVHTLPGPTPRRPLADVMRPQE